MLFTSDPGHNALAIDTIKTGCAGWSLPRAFWPQFPADGTHLTRYSARFNSVEINSSFYRPHQAVTYARWAASVPEDFRFSVKVPKTITHTQRLLNCEDLLGAFLTQVAGLGDKLGCLLVQLPPSLAFDATSAAKFFRALRASAASGARYSGAVALEPRHASWFLPTAGALLEDAQVGRVLADPVLFDAGRSPGGFPGLVYVRLHGSPRMYFSAYTPEVLESLVIQLQGAKAAGHDTWCIFDNTAEGAAVGNALWVTQRLGLGSAPSA